MWLTHVPTVYSQGNNPQYPLIRRWVDPRAGLDTAVAKGTSASARDRTVVLQPVVTFVYLFARRELHKWNWITVQMNRSLRSCFVFRRYGFESQTDGESSWLFPSLILRNETPTKGRSVAVTMTNEGHFISYVWMPATAGRAGLAWLVEQCFVLLDKPNPTQLKSYDQVPRDLSAVLLVLSRHCNLK
jgi:hypothetical protein